MREFKSNHCLVLSFINYITRSHSHHKIITRTILLEYTFKVTNTYLALRARTQVHGGLFRRYGVDREDIDSIMRHREPPVKHPSVRARHIGGVVTDEDELFESSLWSTPVLQLWVQVRANRVEE